MTARKQEIIRVLEQQVVAKRENKLAAFTPYPKQRDFFIMGLTKRERAFLAGTQTGKSEAGAAEAAYHLTGLYPPDWQGKRFDHPAKAWAAAETAEQVRDIAQTKLCGIPGGGDETWGTGMIPRKLLLGKSAGHGVSDGYDQITVRHASGGTSILGFKAYAQGRSKFQGTTLDFVWADEEPDAAIYSEMLSRLTGKGMIYTTCTPLLGYTPFISRFTRESSPDRGVVRMGLRDAQHFDEEEKQRRLAGYPAHERAARENGDPMLGSGAVFEEVTEDQIKTSLAFSDPYNPGRAGMASVPSHWVKLWGIDFGIDHPFAAVLTAWDRDVDVIYVLDCFKISGAAVAVQCSRIKSIAASVPVAWPHDGAAREKGTGEELIALYKREGLLVLPHHATHASGGYGTEAGVAEMLNRMRSGQFKVAAHLDAWFEEFRTYHRKDGLIVKQNDDLLSATRIAVMMRRAAKDAPIGSEVMPRYMPPGGFRIPGADEGKYWGY